MKLKPLYISAPSRSGSSLLVKILNCTANIAVVNEPLNSVNIIDKTNILAIFNFLEECLRYGFMMQRVDIEGLEITDTFPPSKTHWDKIERSLDRLRVIGMKKSFPAFSNKDFFKPFIQQWQNFVKWMNEDMRGGVVVIVRDPRFTILSWKTTFDALRESTENQCAAWNLITDTILSSRDLGIQIVCYEDLIKNPTATVEIVAKYLGVDIEYRGTLPEIKLTSVEDFFNRSNMSLGSIGSIEVEFQTIERICRANAKEFGYFNEVF